MWFVGRRLKKLFMLGGLIKMLKNPNEYEKGKTIVYLVRHGDRIHIPNSPDIGLEISGPGLSEKGKKQAKDVAKKFSKIKEEVDVLYCSGMTRAIETAEEIGKKIGKKPKIVKGLSEYDIIAWTKKFHKKDFWKSYSRHRKSIKVFNRILEKERGNVIVVVVHGNVIKGLILRKMGLSRKKCSMFHHMNCHVSIARYVGKKLNHVCCYNNKNLDH